MLVSLTVGKVDAGVAVLLTDDKRLIEFPSILLPPDITCGSIVDITVARNHASERAAQSSFLALQRQIRSTFGAAAPAAPVLRVRNATQTAVVLEWEPLALATASLRGLALFRDGQKAGGIPRPREVRSTKVSGLAVDAGYAFQLVLRTSAGTLASETVKVRTHKMTELSGISVTLGAVAPPPARDALLRAVERIGARVVDGVRIDTTHFVCTEGRGPAWERAREMNVPVVTPEWVLACEREGRIVGVRGYYLDADPRMRGQGGGGGGGGQYAQPQQQQQQQQQEAQRSQQRVVPHESPRTQITPPTPDEPASGPRSPTGDAVAAAAAAAGKEDEQPPPPPPKSPSPAPAKRPSEANESTEEGSRASAEETELAPSPPPPDDGASDASEAIATGKGSERGGEDGRGGEGETFDEVAL